MAEGGVAAKRDVDGSAATGLRRRGLDGREEKEGAEVHRALFSAAVAAAITKAGAAERGVLRSR